MDVGSFFSMQKMMLGGLKLFLALFCVCSWRQKISNHLWLSSLRVDPAAPAALLEADCYEKYRKAGRAFYNSQVASTVRWLSSSSREQIDVRLGALLSAQVAVTRKSRRSYTPSKSSSTADSASPEGSPPPPGAPPREPPPPPRPLSSSLPWELLQGRWAIRRQAEGIRGKGTKVGYRLQWQAFLHCCDRPLYWSWQTLSGRGWSLLAEPGRPLSGNFGDFQRVKVSNSLPNLRLLNWIGWL